MSREENQQKKEEMKSFSKKEFFEDVPPNQETLISNLAKKRTAYIGDNIIFFPELHLYCSNDNCSGFRWFNTNDSIDKIAPDNPINFFITYTCKNCGQSKKIYAVFILLADDRETGVLYKYGEIPNFGPPTPSRVVSLLGEEKDYYFKGRRSENQGLGIAAFAYYRRVVDNQKDKIFDEIIRIVKKVDSSNTVLLDELEGAKKEQQFTKAVDSIKQAIPQALLIDNHNPLILLHKALSEGLHAKTDEECLEIATSIRVILADLVERLANVLSDNKEIKTAISRLLKKN